MAYGDDIDALGADHRWSFDNTLNDQIGSVNGTGSGTSFTTDPICEDATYSVLTDALTDRVSIPSTTNINNSAQARKAVAGWFVATAVQRPPKRIYGEGDETTSFAMALGWGNNVIFEVDSSAFTLQVYSDVFLADDRPYHLCMIFEGNGYGNELRAFLDGVEQLSAQPTDRQPDSATLAARGVAEFGDPAGTVGLGGVAIELEGNVNGRYNQWATFDGADAVLTDAEVREELFEKGALPDVTISTGTEAAMQTALDVYASTLRPDAPLCIRVQANTGDTSFALDLDDITFSPLASIHVQYTGTATLTLTNTNGSDCSIVSTPNAGTIVLQTEVTLAITVRDVVTNALIVGARCYIEAAAGGDLATGTEIMNMVTNGSGLASITFNYTSDQPILAWVRKGGTSPVYGEGPLPGPITSEGLTATVLLIPDE